MMLKLVDTGHCLGGPCSRSREHPRSEEEAQGPSRSEGTPGAAQPYRQVDVVNRAFHGALLSASDVWDMDARSSPDSRVNIVFFHAKRVDSGSRVYTVRE